MTIKKIGHCCLRIETGDTVLLTDPGMLSTGQNEEMGIRLILITHEHADHLHVESLKKVFAKNPGAKVITNSSVGKILTTEGIAYSVLEGGNIAAVEGVKLEAFGNEHAEIYGSFSRVQNTGYYIDETFFYPGDALHLPPKRPEILALPVAGPWVKTKEAVDYAKAVKPKAAFPVHDGLLSFVTPFHAIPQKFLGEAGIEFLSMLPGDTRTW